MNPFGDHYSLPASLYNPPPSVPPLISSMSPNLNPVLPLHCSMIQRILSHHGYGSGRKSQRKGFLSAAHGLPTGSTVALLQMADGAGEVPAEIKDLPASCQSKDHSLEVICERDSPNHSDFN